MNQEYLIGELSVRLEQLQAAATTDTAHDVACLRREVEAGSVTALASAAERAIELADCLCWESLAAGDIFAFCRQAEVCADLHLFGVCARLVGER